MNFVIEMGCITSHVGGFGGLVLDGSWSCPENWCSGKWIVVDTFLPCLLLPQQCAAFLICLYFGPKFNRRVVLGCLSPVLGRQEGQLESWHIEASWNLDGVNFSIIGLDAEDKCAFTSNF